MSNYELEDDYDRPRRRRGDNRDDSCPHTRINEIYTRNEYSDEMRVERICDMCGEDVTNNPKLPKRPNWVKEIDCQFCRGSGYKAPIFWDSMGRASGPRSRRCDNCKGTGKKLIPVPKGRDPIPPLPSELPDRPRIDNLYRSVDQRQRELGEPFNPIEEIGEPINWKKELRDWIEEDRAKDLLPFGWDRSLSEEEEDEMDEMAERNREKDNDVRRLPRPRGVLTPFLSREEAEKHQAAWQAFFDKYPEEATQGGRLQLSMAYLTGDFTKMICRDCAHPNDLHRNNIRTNEAGCLFPRCGCGGWTPDYEAEAEEASWARVEAKRKKKKTAKPDKKPDLSPAKPVRRQIELED